MKVVILLSLFVLAASKPQYYNRIGAPAPTPGPVYYKPIEPQLFYPSYLQGQFRPSRSDNTAEPIEAAPEAPVEASPREGRAEEVADAAPAPAPAEEPAPEAKAAPVAAPAPAPAAPAYPAPAPAHSGPAAYSFEWLVKDDYTKNDYGQKESRSGANTQGSYHVALPDGRIQTITYTVDGYGGYVANVQYSGEAQYPDTPAYKPAAKAYKPAPAPAYKPAPASTYKPAPAPTYKPAPAPTYKPAPAPVYKPAPAPVYKPHPAPAYPIAPAASVRRYSFRTISNEPAPAEEARSAEGVAVEVLLDEEEIAAPVEVQETARSNEGIAVEAPVYPDAAAAPVEDLIPEESVRSNAGNLVAIIPETTVAPIELVVIEESSINNEENAEVALIIPEAPAAPVELIIEESLPIEEDNVAASSIIPEAPAAPAVQVIDPTTTIAAPVEEETETTTLVNLLSISEVPSESDTTPSEILEVTESNINDFVEPRGQKSLDVAVEEAVEESYVEPSAPVAVEEAPANYRYYYRY